MNDFLNHYRPPSTTMGPDDHDSSTSVILHTCKSEHSIRLDDIIKWPDSLTCIRFAEAQLILACAVKDVHVWPVCLEVISVEMLLV